MRLTNVCIIIDDIRKGPESSFTPEEVHVGVSTDPQRRLLDITCIGYLFLLQLFAPKIGLNGQVIIKNI